MKISAIYVVLAVLILGGFSYLLLTKNSNNSTRLNSPTPSMTPLGGDRDEHGCFGSAGYVWCDSKQKCLRSWEESCDVNPTSSDIDQGTLKSSIKDLLIRKYGTSASPLEINVSKVEGNYAKGTSNEPGKGGGLWFAAKTNGIWKLVWDGNGIINCKALTEYKEYPTDLIPQCYDEAASKMVDK